MAVFVPFAGPLTTCATERYSRVLSRRCFEIPRLRRDIRVRVVAELFSTHPCSDFVFNSIYASMSFFSFLRNLIFSS